MFHNDMAITLILISGSLLIIFFAFYKILTNPDRYRADKKKELPYNKVPSFWEALRIATEEHEYKGFFARTRYITVRYLNYIFHLLARIMPYTKLRTPFHRMRGVKIGKNVQIGPRVFIDEAFPEYVYIANNVAIAPGAWLISHNKVPYAHKGDLESFVAPLVIEKDVWIGTGAIILAGVTIGEGSIVAAGSVVSSSIPPHVLVCGVPARVIKKLGEQT